MDALLAARTLALRAAWRRRDRWSPEQLARHQQEALAAVRRHASERSAFYRRLHAGLTDAPLRTLPIVTKADLMAAFDDAVTDPRLTLAAVEAHLRDLVDRAADPGRPWRRRWWAAGTAGTTGRRGVFVWDRAEWAAVLASYARVNDWAGVGLRVPRLVRPAVVSSLNPTHQSAVVGATLRSPLIPTLRLDATSPIAEQVAALNAFDPQILVGYASALAPLAAEQAAGRLHLRPAAVMSASEVLTSAAARQLADAWGSPPWDVYAATETATIASPCPSGTRHLYEDLVLCEAVDDHGEPVPEGETASRLLVTVLFARTLPLIRYELTDRVALGPASCPCGRPYRTLLGVEGRVQDVLRLPGRDGVVRVPPGVFHGVLDDAPASGWQVRLEDDGVRVLLAGPDPGGGRDEELRRRLLARLEGTGAVGVALRVERVPEIPRTPLGKRPLIRDARQRPT